MIIAIVLGVALWGALTVRDWLLTRRRKGVSLVEFVASFPGIPTAIPTAVFQYYTSVALGENVPISPNDTIEELRIGQDDLDEALQHLVSKLGFELPSSMTLSDSPPILKVADVVTWLDWVGRHQS